ncbi:MAG: hypothetical protein LBT08_05085 [Synergistaceae bacterium]|nr:hypothetical protein [Synergistaceae bacterium]
MSLTFVMGYVRSGAIARTTAAIASAPTSRRMFLIEKVLCRSRPSEKYPTQSCIASRQLTGSKYAKYATFAAPFLYYIKWQ